jgi:hypothetical protein
MEAVHSPQTVTPTRLHAPLLADLWLRQSTTGRGRHHRSAVDVPGPHDYVARRLAPGVPFGEGLKLTAKMVAAIPPEEIGR